MLELPYRQVEFGLLPYPRGVDQVQARRRAVHEGRPRDIHRFQCEVAHLSAELEVRLRDGDRSFGPRNLEFGVARELRQVGARCRFTGGFDAPFGADATAFVDRDLQERSDRPLGRALLDDADDVEGSELADDVERGDPAIPGGSVLAR